MVEEGTPREVEVEDSSWQEVPRSCLGFLCGSLSPCAQLLKAQKVHFPSFPATHFHAPVKVKAESPLSLGAQLSRQK